MGRERSSKQGWLILVPFSVSGKVINDQGTGQFFFQLVRHNDMEDKELACCSHERFNTKDGRATGFSSTVCYPAPHGGGQALLGWAVAQLHII